MSNCTIETFRVRDDRKEGFGKRAEFFDDLPPETTGIVELYLGNTPIVGSDSGRTLCLGGGFRV